VQLDLEKLHILLVFPLVVLCSDAFLVERRDYFSLLKFKWDPKNIKTIVFLNIALNWLQERVLFAMFFSIYNTKYFVYDPTAELAYSLSSCFF
jgi:hypothetical protein